MCESCVKIQSPDRGSLCLESGAFLANLVSCHGCGRMDTIVAGDHSESTTPDDAQEINFNHVCNACGHVVAHHQYLFWVDDGFQNYEMSCMLCGHADDERSCLPQDPRKEAVLY